MGLTNHAQESSLSLERLVPLCRSERYLIPTNPPHNMPNFMLAIFLMFPINNLQAQTNQIIEIKRVEKTDSAIVIEGIAKVIPAGTVIKVSVLGINGKPLDDDKHTIRTVDEVVVRSDGTFTAKLQRSGSLGGQWVLPQSDVTWTGTAHTRNGFTGTGTTCTFRTGY